MSNQAVIRTDIPIYQNTSVKVVFPFSVPDGDSLANYTFRAQARTNAGDLVANFTLNVVNNTLELTITDDESVTHAVGEHPWDLIGKRNSDTGHGQIFHHGYYKVKETHTRYS